MQRTSLTTDGAAVCATTHLTQFAVVSDVIIRRVRRLCPSVLLRAYADDIALVLRRGPEDCRQLDPIFDEYRNVSGLRLHTGKSILAPLSLHSTDPATPNQMNNKKLWPTAQASLSTADKRVVLGDCVLAADRAVQLAASQQRLQQVHVAGVLVRLDEAADGIGTAGWRFGERRGARHAFSLAGM